MRFICLSVPRAITCEFITWYLFKQSQVPISSPWLIMIAIFSAYEPNTNAANADPNHAEEAEEEESLFNEIAKV